MSKLKINPYSSHEFILQQNNISLSSASSWTRSKEQIKKNPLKINVYFLTFFTQIVNELLYPSWLIQFVSLPINSQTSELDKKNRGLF